MYTLRTFSLILLLAFTYNIVSARNVDSLEQALPQMTDSSKAAALNTLALVYQNTDPLKALEYCKESIRLAYSTGQDRVLANVLSIMGSLKKSQGEYDEAIKYHLNSLRLNEKTGHKRGMAVSYNDLGVLYKNMKQYPSALKYYKRSLQVCRELDLGLGIAMTLNNIGTIYYETRDYDKAKEYYVLSLAKGREIDHLGAISTALSNLAEIYAIEGADEKAYEYFKEVLEIDRRMDHKYGIIMSQLNIGILLKNQGKYNEAVKSYTEAMEMSRAVNARPQLRDSYASLSSLYASMGNYEKALEYKNSYISLQDSIINEENQKNIAELQTKYDTEKKEQEIALLNQEKEIQSLRIEQKDQQARLQLYISLGIIILILIVTFFLIYRNRLKQKAEYERKLNLIQQQRFKAVMEAQEQERKRIAEELHDGLGQLLSTAKLNVSSLEDTIADKEPEDMPIFNNAIELIDEACSEIRNISHNMMPGALIKLGLLPAVRELTRKVNTHDNIEVLFHTEGFDERISESAEIAIYRIIQEALNNILKHAGADKVEISLKKVDTIVSLLIKDNGVGMDTAMIASSKGIGWKNIYSRVSMLNGNIDIHSGKGKGTSININIAA